MKMIKDVKCLQFNFPVPPVPPIITNLDGTTSQEKINEMNVYVLKYNELIHNRKDEFIKKEEGIPNYSQPLFTLIEILARRG